MLECIFQHLQSTLETMNFHYREQRWGRYSLAFAVGTNRSYMNNQLELNEKISCFINDHVQKVERSYRFKIEEKFKKKLIVVVNRINQMLPSSSSLTSSIATTSPEDNLRSNGRLFSSKMNSSTTSYLYNVGQSEQFIPHPVPSSINQKLHGNVDEAQLTTSSTKMCYNEFDTFDMDNEELHLNRTYGPDNGISYNSSTNQVSTQILNPNIRHISTSIDIMNLSPHMKIQVWFFCLSIRFNKSKWNDHFKSWWSIIFIKILLPLPLSFNTMQQHLHHLPPLHYIKMQNMDPLLAPPSNHQQQYMDPLFAPPSNHQQQ
ncbi:unnamed protein product [Rotaria sp. Silwood1]|nr:unnamed protein product [Rotaria sp. Silwood1]